MIVNLLAKQSHTPGHELSLSGLELHDKAITFCIMTFCNLVIWWQRPRLDEDLVQLGMRMDSVLLSPPTSLREVTCSEARYILLTWDGVGVGGWRQLCMAEESGWNTA